MNTIKPTGTHSSPTAIPLKKNSSENQQRQSSVVPASSIYLDNRGSLHSLKNFLFSTKEVLVSHSHRGVLRGLHYSPYSKQVYIVKGSILDFWYQPETGNWFEKVVCEGDTVVVPENAMHGFFALTDVDMLYFLESQFSPEFDVTYHWTSPGLPFSYGFPTQNLIISQKDDEAVYFNQSDYLLLGSTGFLGSYTERVLCTQRKTYQASSVRLDNLAELEKLIKKTGCKYVICAAGISGRPTTQWCEENEKETFEVNYLQMVQLMQLTHRLGVHFTIYGTGLLYKPDPTISTFDENVKPNLDNSVYVRYRVEMESHLRLYPNVLCLRILYPVTADSDSKCFLTKMKQRKDSVHNVSVAVTVVPSLFPMIPKIIEGGVTGPLNFVNGGTISLPNLLGCFGVKANVVNDREVKGTELCTKKLEEVTGERVVNVADALKSLRTRD